jgi:hypothetical protein
MAFKLFSALSGTVLLFRELENVSLVDKNSQISNLIR